MGKYQRLRDLREDMDLTQKQLAEKLFINAGQYARYERGDREIPFELAISIAKFHNVSLDYLAGRTNDKHPKLGVNDIVHAFNMLSDFEKGQVYEKITAISKSRMKPAKK